MKKELLLRKITKKEEKLEEELLIEQEKLKQTIREYCSDGAKENDLPTEWANYRNSIDLIQKSIESISKKISDLKKSIDKIKAQSDEINISFIKENALYDFFDDECAYLCTFKTGKITSEPTKVIIKNISADDLSLYDEFSLIATPRSPIGSGLLKARKGETFSFSNKNARTFVNVLATPLEG